MINGWLWMAWAISWITSALFTNRTRWSESRLSRMVYSIPFGLGFYLIFHRREPGYSLFYNRFWTSSIASWIGNGLTVVGFTFAWWARVHLGRYWSGTITLKEGHRLIRTGPYRLARHPIYTGFLSAVLGSAIAASTGDAMIGFVLIVGSIVLKMHREEALMTREFPDEYRQFKAEVPALIPFVLEPRR
jgi:protein-S-isoprenylcysteine O-methyltransferase Ste14